MIIEITIFRLLFRSTSLKILNISQFQSKWIYILAFYWYCVLYRSIHFVYACAQPLVYLLTLNITCVHRSHRITWPGEVDGDEGSLHLLCCSIGLNSERYGRSVVELISLFHYYEVITPWLLLVWSKRRVDNTDFSWLSWEWRLH